VLGGTTKVPLEEPTHRATLRRTVWAPVLLTVAGWAMGGALGLSVTFSLVGLFGRSFGAGIGWTIGGMLGGYARSLRLIDPLVRGEQIVMVTIGWAVAAGIGGILSWDLLSVGGGMSPELSPGRPGALSLGSGSARFNRPSRGWASGY
jgi:hypothetical protein